jgi:hypothetical protein
MRCGVPFVRCARLCGGRNSKLRTFVFVRTSAASAQDVFGISISPLRLVIIGVTANTVNKGIVDGNTGPVLYTSNNNKAYQR